MNADQAWDEFQDQIDGVKKSDATVSSKLDVLANLLADVGNDTSRTAETVIPQLAGDQGAIDAANDQAAALGGAPPMGAPGEMPPADPGMGEDAGGMSPVDAGAPDMGAPAPDMGGAPPMDAPPMDMPPAPDMGAGVPPAPDVGGDMGGMPPMDTGAPDMGGAPPMDAGAPGMDAGAPGMEEMPPMGEDMGGMPDYSQFAYTKDDVFSDMLAGMTSEAHNALDQGDMEEVAKITQFIEGVQALWAQTFGAAPLPAEPDPAQISAMPAEAMGGAPDMGGMPPAEAPAPEMPPAEGGVSDMPGDMPPETGGEPAGGEPADDGPKEGQTEDEAEKEKSAEEDKDDDKVKKSEGCDKSEDEEDVEKADDAGGDTPAEEASDAVTDDAVDKATGVTDIKPGETGVKKSFFGDRMNVMEAVMNEKEVPQDAFMPLRRSEMPSYQRTSDLDVRKVFAEGGCIKSSSRPAAMSAMGDYRSRGDEAMQDRQLSDSLNNLRKSFAPTEGDGEPDEMAKQMNRLTTGLRIRKAA